MGRAQSVAWGHGLMENPLRSYLTEEIPHLRRYARALVGNHEEADDLVQACLERALSKASQWDPSKGLRSWLFRILHNHFVSSRRSQTREQEFQRRYPVKDTVPPNQENLFDLDTVQNAMHRLPEDHREALLLVAVSGFSYEEASNILSVPIGTVRSRLSRAREGLRMIMDQTSRDDISGEEER